MKSQCEMKIELQLAAVVEAADLDSNTIYLAADVVLPDPMTGGLRTVREAAEQQSIHLAVLDKWEEDIVPTTACAYSRGEPTQLFKVVTESGREIEAVGDVRLFDYMAGWKAWRCLRHLKAGDVVNIVSNCPQLFGAGSPLDETVKMIAYSLVEKNPGDLDGVLRTNDVRVGADFEKASAGDQVGGFERARSAPKGTDRVIPDLIFTAREGKVSLFLNRLFTVDGQIAERDITLRSSSPVLLRQVQHLLSRFGVLSFVSDSAPRGVEGDGHFLRIGSGPSVRCFLDRVGFFGDKADEANALYQRMVALRATPKEDFSAPIDPEIVRSVTPTRVAPVYGVRVDQQWLIANGLLVRARSA